MDSRTSLILFNVLIFHLYYIPFSFVLILFLLKFSFKSCVFESYGFSEKKKGHLISCRGASLQLPRVRLRTLT